MIIPAIAGFIVACAFFSPLVTGSAEALTVPERLVYDLTWTGIKAGTATQEIVPDRDGLKIVSTARSADWIDLFFPIEDRIETTLSGSASSILGTPRNYRMKIREGRHRRDKEIVFRSEEAKAYYTDHLSGQKAIIPITARTYDIYSGFYLFRFARLEVGKSVYVTILDGKEVWELEIKVLKKEKLKTKFGDVNTFLLKPQVRSEGVFENKGEVSIWITDDDRRLPVKLQAKVMIGSIVATLVGIR